MLAGADGTGDSDKHDGGGCARGACRGSSLWKPLQMREPREKCDEWFSQAMSVVRPSNVSG